MPVHDAVVAPPCGPRATPSCAQHTWVAASHREPPHAMPPPLDPEPLVEVDPAPPLDPDPLVDASSVFPEPGIRGAMPSSSWLRDPHPMASKTAMVEIVLIGFMDGVAAAAVAGERSLP